MDRIYLDNAATTPLAPEVLEAMIPYFTEYYGNPSSTHGHGRKAKIGLENARKTVAKILNVTPGEIFFTSGGTEADNMAINQSIESLGVNHIVTSHLEHHAVLHTIEHLQKTTNIKVTYLENDAKGVLDLSKLSDILQNNHKSLVSLMHGNNEIGNLLSLETVGQIARTNGAYFHSDTVQTMGHFHFDLKNTPVDFITCGAHKFHGPKGVGFLYVNAKNKISPMLHGGSQEREMRGGTENIYGIIGLAKALEIADKNIENHLSHIKGLKSLMISLLKENIKDVRFNGLSDDLEKSLYTVLNVSFPVHPANEMLLFNLDIAGISCSGGSACASGSNQGSHVLTALGIDSKRANVRFSFSRYTNKEDIIRTVDVLKNIFETEKV